MTFHIGQKVVCVIGTYRDLNWSYVPNRPVANNIYTVRAILPGWFDDGRSALLLEEITNGLDRWKGSGLSECGFGVWRFRPIVERKTDISIFTKMLIPEGVEA